MRTAFFLYLAQRGADFLIAVNHSCRKRFRLILDRLIYGRRVPFKATATEVGHGRTITWSLRAKPAPELVVYSWPGSTTIITVLTTGIRSGRSVDVDAVGRRS